MAEQATPRRRVPVHHAFIRPLLIMGCERELFLSSAVISAAFIFVLAKPFFVVVGLAFWFSAIFVLQRMAKADPQMTKVYIRQVKYRIYYPAQAHPTGTQPIPK